jgi:GntR family transcriptional repressor for pyruvate dehydrogenase complex
MASQESSCALRPIKKSNLYHEVIEHLKAYIVENRLQPGDRLPTEAVLAQSLDVSRLSVREGLKVLESLGVVQIRPRDGTRLRALSIQPAVDHLRFMFDVQHVPMADIAAARQIIECALMPSVLRHATEADYAHLDQAIEDYRVALEKGDLDGAVRADGVFHHTLLKATRNRALEGFGSMLQQFFRHLTPGMHPELDRSETWRQHRGIYDALRAGDASLAAEVMRVHLEPYTVAEERGGMG